MAFATGKYSQAICDRCGYQYPYLDLKKEWNGLFVCQECFKFLLLRMKEKVIC